MMRCYNYFRLLIIYLFTTTDNVSLETFSTQIFNPTLFRASLVKFIHMISCPMHILCCSPFVFVTHYTHLLHMGYAI